MQIIIVRVVKNYLRSAVLLLCMLYASSYACAASIQDRLMGKGANEFTLVYKLKRYNKLEGASNEQIEDLLNKSIKDINNRTKNSSSKISKSYEAGLLDSMPPWISRSSSIQDGELTISVRGNLLLFKRDIPSLGKTEIVFFDGKRTMTYVMGSDAQIFPGFDFTWFRDFIFPGSSICGISFAQNMNRMSSVGSGSTYTGSFAFNDGFTDVGGLPQYRPGEITTGIENGEEVVTSLRVGWKGQNEQILQYSNYTPLQNGMTFPAKVSFEAITGTSILLPYDKYYTISYELVKFSPQSLPAEEFSAEAHLSDKAIVQVNEKNTSKAIVHTQGKTIEEQFAEKKKQDDAQSIRQIPEKTPQGLLRYIGIFAVVGAIAGWFFYRRSKTA